MFGRWTFPIYSGSSCNFALPRALYPLWRANLSSYRSYAALIATNDSCNRTYLVATNAITIRYEAPFLAQSTHTRCYSHSFTIAFPRSLQYCLSAALQMASIRALNFEAVTKGKTKNRGSSDDRHN